MGKKSNCALENSALKYLMGIYSSVSIILSYFLQQLCEIRTSVNTITKRNLRLREDKTVAQDCPDMSYEALSKFNTRAYLTAHLVLLPMYHTTLEYHTWQEVINAP